MRNDQDWLLLNKTLTYANGYRELGMFDEALKELENVKDAMRQTTAVIQMHVAIFIDANRWLEALPFANRLASSESSDPANLVNLAYVTRRANSLKGARIILENAAKRFPEEAIIQYNLGCYACCSNEMDQAKTYLRRAFALDPRYLDTSATDEDLESLRDWLAFWTEQEN